MSDPLEIAIWAAAFVKHYDVSPAGAFEQSCDETLVVFLERKDKWIDSQACVAARMADDVVEAFRSARGPRGL